MVLLCLTFPSQAQNQFEWRKLGSPISPPPLFSAPYSSRRIDFKPESVANHKQSSELLSNYSSNVSNPIQAVTSQRPPVLTITTPQQALRITTYQRQPELRITTPQRQLELRITTPKQQSKLRISTPKRKPVLRISTPQPTPVLRITTPRPQHTLPWQKAVQTERRTQFAPLFGRVTPFRIEQTLHELTTKKGIDDVGEVSKFSLFHGKKRKNHANLSKASSSFMQKVTRNYIKNLKSTQQQEKFKRKVESAAVETSNSIKETPLAQQSREIDNDSDDAISNMNMIYEDIKPLVDDKKNKPDYSLKPQNQNIEHGDDLQTPISHINVGPNASKKDLADTYSELDKSAGYGDTFAFFNAPEDQSYSEEYMPLESKSLNSDFIKSTYELEQEKDYEINEEYDNSIYKDSKYNDFDNKETEYMDSDSLESDYKDSDNIIPEYNISDNNITDYEDYDSLEADNTNVVNIDSNITDSVNYDFNSEDSDYNASDSKHYENTNSEYTDSVNNNSDYKDSEYSIGQAPSLTDIATLKIIDFKDSYETQNLIKSSSSSNNVHSPTQEGNGFHGSDFDTLQKMNIAEEEHMVKNMSKALVDHSSKDQSFNQSISSLNKLESKINEADSYGSALGPILEDKKVLEKKLEKNNVKENKYSQAFMSPSLAFDSFGSETFSNARFRIPEQFRKLLQPPQWINDPRW